MYKNNYSSNGIFYEKTFNLLYIKKNYSPSNQGKSSILKKESNKESEYSNLFIWNIDVKQKTMIFSKEIANDQQIQKVIFEEYYDEKEQCIVFSSDTQLLNNTKISFRHPKNQLLIETYHKKSETHHLWVCDKHGNNLKKIADFSSNTQWHLDVGNSVIRLLKHDKRDLQIEDIPW